MPQNYRDLSVASEDRLDSKKSDLEKSLNGMTVSLALMGNTIPYLTFEPSRGVVSVPGIQPNSPYLGNPNKRDEGELTSGQLMTGLFILGFGFVYALSRMRR